MYTKANLAIAPWILYNRYFAADAVFKDSRDVDNKIWADKSRRHSLVIR